VEQKPLGFCRNTTGPHTSPAMKEWRAVDATKSCDSTQSPRLYTSFLDYNEQEIVPVPRLK
ncbi:unnamed protein product, partial [Heterotrigona itama]